MHIANGIVSGPVSALFAIIAAAALAFCVVKARADLDERLAPMAGLVAAFIVPDVVTGMVALLIPLILLFEMGLWLAREPKSTATR